MKGGAYNGGKLCFQNKWAAAAGSSYILRFDGCAVRVRMLTKKIGAPGADRCIINTKGQYAGAVTHTGVSHALGPALLE